LSAIDRRTTAKQRQAVKAETLLVLVVLSFSAQACAGSNSSQYPKNRVPTTNVAPEHVSDELLVLFTEGTSELRISEINGSLNVQLIRTMLPGRSYLIRVPKERGMEETRQAYLSLPEVEAVELNYKARIL
jgi:hypothetical protein